jgi:predicted nicotinamide N-methyase
MYKEEILTLSIKDHTYKLIQIANIDEVFDALITMHPHDPKVVDEQIPYWTELWPSALAMAAYLIENPQILKGKSVIEIGGGLGLPSIVAANVAAKIIYSDYLPEAIQFAKKNATLNGCTNMQFAQIDWRHIEEDTKYDIILASDIAYEKRFFADLPFAFRILMHPQSKVILTEPGRKFTKAFIDELKENFIVVHKTRNITHRGTSFSIGVYEIELK